MGLTLTRLASIDWRTIINDKHCSYPSHKQQARPAPAQIIS